MAKKDLAMGLVRSAEGGVTVNDMRFVFRMFMEWHEWADYELSWCAEWSDTYDVSDVDMAILKWLRDFDVSDWVCCAFRWQESRLGPEHWFEVFGDWRAVCAEAGFFTGE